MTIGESSEFLASCSRRLACKLSKFRDIPFLSSCSWRSTLPLAAESTISGVLGVAEVNPDAADGRRGRRLDLHGGVGKRLGFPLRAMG